MGLGALAERGMSWLFESHVEFACPEQIVTEGALQNLIESGLVDGIANGSESNKTTN